VNQNVTVGSTLLVSHFSENFTCLAASNTACSWKRAKLQTWTFHKLYGACWKTIIVFYNFVASWTCQSNLCVSSFSRVKGPVAHPAVIWSNCTSNDHSAPEVTSLVFLRGYRAGE